MISPFKTFSLQIYGRVQGVWFRGSAKKVAEELGLSGYAMNQPDGSVYIEVSGEESTLARFIEWCHEGPELARVDQVIQTEILLRSFHGFEIRR